MADFTFTLAKRTGGREVYVRAVVAVECPVEREVISIDEGVSPRFADAALSGIRYALDRPETTASVRVLELTFNENATRNAVAYAASHAVWGALGTTGTIPLSIAGDDLSIDPDA